MPDLHEICARLYPILRSLTGDGVRQTFDIIDQVLVELSQTDASISAPRLKRTEIASGTNVFDWQVPLEWNVSQAWIKDPAGKVIVDLAEHNLHLLAYSEPVHQKLSLEQLKPHLFSLPDQANLIPYRTSYYQRTWGFCLQHELLETLSPGTYEVRIDSRLEAGHMSLAEVFLPGLSDQEIVISTHICHPSLANDNLSGIAVACGLIASLQAKPAHFGVRFLFVPATIGAIAWLDLNQHRFGQIAHSLVLSNLGDDGPFHYKQSRDGDSSFDRIFAYLATTALATQSAPEQNDAPVHIEPFSPYGYDERQFNSPGVNLAAGSLMRTPFARYPQYHTSADDLSFISNPKLQGAMRLITRALRILQHDHRYRNLSPMGEPQLGRRGLYDQLGGQNDAKHWQLAMLWVLNQSNGERSLLDIAIRSGLDFELIRESAHSLESADLLLKL